MSFRHYSSYVSNMNETIGLGSISSNSNNTLNIGNVSASSTAINTAKFGPRALRSETRAKAKDEIKKVRNVVQKVKKWEKRLVSLNDSSLKIYKWVPVSVNLPSMDQNCRRDETSAHLRNRSSYNYSLNINPKLNTIETPQINKTIVFKNLNKFASLNLANRAVLNHDENAQDFLSACDRGVGKLNSNQSFSTNNEDLINDNNSSSSSLASNSSQLLPGPSNVNLTDLNNNVMIASDSESSNQNSNLNDTNLGQCDSFTQIETINNNKMRLKQNGPAMENLDVKDMPLTTYYETFFR
jgi:hypothetical protein